MIVGGVGRKLKADFSEKWLPTCFLRWKRKIALYPAMLYGRCNTLEKDLKRVYRRKSFLKSKRRKVERVSMWRNGE